MSVRSEAVDHSMLSFLSSAETPLSVLVISLTAFATSTVTAIIGAGGGTALLLVMLYFLPAASVVPAHGCIQLVANTTRVILFRRHMHWPVILRFVLPMPLGVYVGLQIHHMMSAAALQLAIAGFVLLSLLIRKPTGPAEGGLPGWIYVVTGFVTGIGNVLVGVIAPLLGAILRFESLSKERVVGTLGFFGFAGNVFKVAGFSLVGFAFADFLVTIICASLATIVGNILGKRVLSGVSNRMFARAFQIMLGLLATSLIWDALATGLGGG